MKLFDEFKTFALRGNVIDMAVGIIIGAAFTSIVKSLVDDIMMPVIGLATQGVDYSQIFFVLKHGDPKGPYQSILDAKDAGAVTLNFGSFLSATISFLLVALALFLVVKFVSKLYKKDEKPKKPAKPPRQEVLLEEIRDAILKQKQK